MHYVHRISPTAGGCITRTNGAINGNLSLLCLCRGGNEGGRGEKEIFDRSERCFSMCVQNHQGEVVEDFPTLWQKKMKKFIINDV